MGSCLSRTGSSSAQDTATIYLSPGGGAAPTMFFSIVNGQMVGGEDMYFHARCGKHFSDYVKRTRSEPFPYNTMSGGCMTHTNLWAGRRLRIKMHSSELVPWREAKVLEFDEYMIGPFAGETRWTVTIEFTDRAHDTSGKDKDGGSKFVVGDEVELKEGSPSEVGQYTVASVEKVEEKTVRYVVRYGDKTLTVPATSLDPVESMELGIHRINVQGGGVLLINHSETKLSFEWLEDASPAVNILEEPWHVTCPSCRKTSTSDQIYEMTLKKDGDGAATTGTQDTTECPVCLEEKECQTLPTCSHKVCSSCVAGWRSKLDGEKFFSSQDIVVELSPEDAEKEIKKNFEKIPENRCTEQFCELAREEVQKVFEDMDNYNGDDERVPYAMFKRFLLTQPIELWGVLSFDKMLCQNLSIEPAEILVTHVESLRGKEAYKRFATGVIEESRKYGTDEERLSGYPAEYESFLEDPDNFHDVQMHQLTEIIAVKYENDGDYRSAIGWYEKNLQYVPKKYEEGTPIGGLLAISLNNLALAQKRAALFQSSLASYTRAIEVGGPSATPIIRNKVKVEEEIEEWVGTSGKPTPRLDE